MLRTEVDASFRASRRERDLPHHLAGLDPGRVLNLTGIIEIQEDVVVFKQVSGRLRHHDHTPGRAERGGFCDRTEQPRHERVLLVGREGKLHPRIVHQSRLTDCGIQSIRQDECQGALAFVVGSPGCVLRGRKLRSISPLRERSEMVQLLRERRDVRHCSLLECKLGGFILDVKDRCGEVLRIMKAERSAFIVDADDNLERIVRIAVPDQADSALVVVVSDPAPFAIDGLPYGIL